MTQLSSAVVLDTSVVSRLFRTVPETAYYEDRIQGRELFISFQTLEEMWFGAYNANWGERRQDELANHLDAYEVIWPNSRVTDECARLRIAQRRKGRELKTADAWIAATALWLGCPLASHDRDFSGVEGLTLIQAPG